MGEGIEFVPNNAGITELLNSSGVQAVCKRKADAIARQAQARSGHAYRTDVRAGKSRAHARVSTTDAGGWWSQMRDKTLSGSVDAG